VWTATKRGYNRGWLVVSDVSGGDKRALTPPLGGAERRLDHYPAWSPDGSRVAFMRWTPGRVALMVVSSDGSDLHQVAEVRRAPDTYVLDDFRWSPDGSRLAYSVSRRNPEHWTPGIYVVGADGSGRRLLARLPKKPFGYLSLFDWTPDGRRVTYSFTVGEGLSLHYTGPSHLKTVSADGAGTANLLTEDAIINASWSADGRLFYVRHCIDRPCQLALRDPAAGHSRPLTHFKSLDCRVGPCYDAEWDELPFMRRPQTNDIVYTHGYGRTIYEFSPATNKTRTVRTLRCPRRPCGVYEDSIYLAGITTDGRYALIEFDDVNDDSLSELTRHYRLDLDTGSLTRIHLATADPAEIYLP
jgi:dipeptidyl aminopeptidase/acylaminoacyl peptidase